MAYNPDLEAVVSYTKSQKIILDFQEFQFQVETHPDYPSLLAFSDALSFFNIPNVAFNLSFEEIDNLPDSFIALLSKEHQQPNLYHIKKQGNHYLYLEEKKSIKIVKEQLKLLWQNIVLLAEKPVEPVEKNKSKIFSTKFIFAVLVAFILGMVWLFSHSFYLAIFGVLIIIGVFFSIEALKTELGLESKISESFCRIVANADCGQVINSTKNKWLQKIKISDISLVFFTSQLLTLLIFSVAGFSEFFGYVLIALLLSLPMTLYSIFFQYKIEKKWCPICLSIIGTVYAELVFLLFIKQDFYFEGKTLSLFFIVYLIVFGLVYLLKPVFLERKDLNEKYIKQLRFSRNYEVFKNTLQKSETQFFEKEYIVLGNRGSKYKISIVTSPLCGYCKDAHHILDSIFTHYADKIAVSIRFNFDENFDEKTQNLFLRLSEIYEQKGDNTFMEALKEWFEYKNFKSWFSKFGLPENTESVREILKEITKENLILGLNFTPNILLNQYSFPKQYDREDLEYFLADWIEDEEL